MKNQFYILIFTLFICGAAIGQSDTGAVKTAIVSATESNSIDPGTYQIEVVNKSFDRLVENLTEEKKDKKSIWDTLIPLLIGAVLTLFGQLTFWWLNKKKEQSQLKLETKAELNRLKHLLCDHYRELAMHKAHKLYWYAQFEKSNNEKNEEEAKNFYSLHLETGNKVRATEIKISSTFSEFYGLVNKLQYLTKFDKKTKGLIDKYYEFKPIKPNPIDSKIDKLRAEEKIEEERLLENYKGFTKPITEIVEHLNKK
jgi:hypothetical protein